MTTGNSVQAEHEQQQKYSDLGTDLDKVPAETKRCKSSVAKGQAREQIERYRGESPSAGEARKQCETNGRQPKFNKDDGKVVSMLGQASLLERIGVRRPPH